MLPNPYVLLGGLVGVILLVLGCSWLAYHRGADDQRNAQTEQQLSIANLNLKDAQDQNNKVAKAGEVHDVHNTQVTVDNSAIARQIAALVAKLPAGGDPYVPVWFVRMFDRSASRWKDGDPYPGKPDNDPSDVRLSEALTMLAANYGKCEANRVQLKDVIDLKPVLPHSAPEDKPGFFDKINPF